ncbi:trigger factor [Roseiconus nitratireducens]|uniref:Trigger factor n=1 Tax=Roseiconus nitratireducens TaxID=2605748 RepID=A0A5M6CYC3_9BACT|nr:trigger factor [Roseiconus nitratireducens]KAA5540201.1 trigger factor [Roseiconus nitratireducens]
MSTSIDSPNAAEETTPIQVEVEVKSPQPCVRDVVVTVPESEVKRYLKKEYDELVPEAQVPGFRSGRAPRQLVEKQFKERVTEAVKGKLLMDALSQVTESQDFSAISEPDFDYNSIPDPGEGPFTFQFSIEVRPEFKTPEWKGLELTKSVEKIDDEAVSNALDRVLKERATFEATDEPAEMGDRLLVTIKFREGDKVLSTMEEKRVNLAEQLSLADGICEQFGKDVAGKKEGDVVTTPVTLAGQDDAEGDSREIVAEVQLVEVMKQEKVELTDEILEDLGDFESEDELREFIKDSLTRQSEYRAQQEVRKTVTDLLADSVEFELPEDLVRRQTNRELQRRILEMRRNGFDDTTIRGIVNALQQNARVSTESALREHFVLEQIAEEESLDAEPSEFDAEIALIAQQSGQSLRRTRARLEKTGQMDALRNQIVERKVIERIVENAKVTEKEVTQDAGEEAEKSFPVGHSVLGTKDASAIPDAKYEDNSVPTPGEKESE